MGTQRVEEELRRLYPELEPPRALLRLDSDSIRGAAAWHTALEDLRKGAARVAVGTQMIAKGHDIPSVRLVGVINADTSINLPDFRAAERTFQLISQVAGRAGRAADLPGRVVVQTFSPGVAAVERAARHDYEGFADAELRVRTPAALPPVGRMARLVIRDEKHERAARRAAELHAALAAHTRELRAEHVRLRGPMPCAISRIADEHRIAIELLAPDSAIIQRILTEARNAGEIRSDAALIVDVDPVALL
jgi:primosomal protein N' (replication factor Y)